LQQSQTKKLSRLSDRRNWRNQLDSARSNTSAALVSSYQESQDAPRDRVSKYLAQDSILEVEGGDEQDDRPDYCLAVRSAQPVLFEQEKSPQ